MGTDLPILMMTGQAERSKAMKHDWSAKTDLEILIEKAIEELAKGNNEEANRLFQIYRSLGGK